MASEKRADAGREDDPGRSFERLWKTHHHRIRGFVSRKLGRKARKILDTDDILQDARLSGLRAFKRSPELRKMNAGSFLAWIRTIILHRILDGVHKAGSHVRIDTGHEPPARSPTPSEMVAREERKEQIRDALTKLSEREREVVTLVRLQGLKPMEAARRMGLKSESLYVLLSRALKKLGGIFQQRGLTRP